MRGQVIVPREGPSVPAGRRGWSWSIQVACRRWGGMTPGQEWQDRAEAPGVSRTLGPGPFLLFPPGLTAGLRDRCSWRFRRSGGSGTCVSVHCAPCPSAAPPASAPAASPTAPRPAPRSRAGAPAGPASSERSEQGHHGHRPRWVLREQDTASGQSISPQAA